jgi:uncharacterized protein DUF5681
MTGFDDSDTESSTHSNAEPAGGYQVGFCKPPADHRFKPGHSGNPDGRRKVVGNIILSLRAGLNEKIRITKGTVEKNVTKEEVALRMLINKSLKGDWKAFMALMKKGVKIGIVKPIRLPNFRGGVVCLPIEYWHTKSRAELLEAADKEAARRNARWAQGLPYDR